MRNSLSIVNPQPFSDDNPFLVMFNDSTVFDQDLTLLRQKHKSFKQAMHQSEVQRTLSVQKIKMRTTEKKKLEQSMKNVRVTTKKGKVNKQELIQTTAKRLILFQSPVFTEISCYWSRIPVEGWIPETREGATLSWYNKRLYLIGGLSSNILGQVLELPISAPSWKKIEGFNYKFDAVFGHTAVVYERQIIIFGGASEYNEISRKREHISMVRVFYPDTKKLNYSATHGAIYEFRRFHSAICMKKHLVVYGGQSPKNFILDSCLVLNLISLKWRNLDTIGQKPPGLAGHSACSVYFPEKFTSFFKKSRKIKGMRIQGMYIFGGYKSEFVAQNVLYLLNPGSRPLKWVIFKTANDPPSARYYHSMTWVQNINSLVVYGGRNDSIGVNYGDVHVLRLDSANWMKCNISGSPPIPRNSHCTATDDKRLYIFGGVSNGRFCQSELLTVSFDFSGLNMRKKSYIFPSIK